MCRFADFVAIVALAVVLSRLFARRTTLVIPTHEEA